MKNEDENSDIIVKEQFNSNSRIIEMVLHLLLKLEITGILLTLNYGFYILVHIAHLFIETKHQHYTI